MAKSNLLTALEYAENVCNGTIPAPIYVKVACKRMQDDLQREDLYLDEAVLDRFCRFAHEFKHYKGAKSGERFTLEPWQVFIAANILGLKRKSTGRRKYRMADIYVPRKNGKTYISAVFALFFLLQDGESGAEVYTAAVDQAQARLCYNDSEVLLKNSLFAPRCKSYTWGMKALKNDGVYKPLSRDTKNKDGLNIHAAICDERHAWPNTEMLDVIKTGMGARSQPMILSISTAGTDVSNPYFRDIETYKDELMGVKPLEDDHFFMLFCPDEGDSWEDPEVWRKVNPNYGVSLDEEYMRSTYEEARIRGGSFVVAFQTKNLNMWVDAPEVWLPDEDVVANSADFDREKLKGMDCYVGIDLAAKTDITAVALWFPNYQVLDYMFIIPEEKVKSVQDRVDYRLWAEQGWVTIAPGKVLDEDFFVEKFMQKLAPYHIKAVAYDPWGMWNLLPKLSKYQEQLMEYRQDIRYMSVPTKWLESSILQHKLNLLSNPVIRWMFKNVVVYHDPNDNLKLDKARSRNKIDGVVASVDAIGAWLNSGKSEKTIYSMHSLRSIKL